MGKTRTRDEPAAQVQVRNVAYGLRNRERQQILADWFWGGRAPGGEGLTTGAAVSAFSLNSPDAGGSRQTSQPLPLTLHGVCNRRGWGLLVPWSSVPARQRPIPVMPGLPHLHHPWNSVGLAAKAKDTGACCSTALQRAQADRSLGQCQTPRHAFFMASNSRLSGNFRWPYRVCEHSHYINSTVRTAVVDRRQQN